MWDLFDGYPVEVAVSNAATQTAFATPSTVGRYRHLSAMVCLCIVDIELKRPGLVSLDEGEKVL